MMPSSRVRFSKTLVSATIAMSPSNVRYEGGGAWWMALIYLALHLAALSVFWMGITRDELLLCLVLLQLRGLCLSVGYHRLLAHKSFRTSRPLQFVFAWGAAASMRGGPLWWVALHRHHHRVSDTEHDVFTPDKGFLWSYGLWLLSGRYDHTDYDRVRDLASLPELRWLNRFWLVPATLLAAACVALGGWSGFANVFCLSSVLLLHSLACIDALNHYLGFQRYNTGDQSRNSFVLALLCNGEGWHNNHHHYPASARYGFYWFEPDGAFTFLRILSWFGLVWDLKVPSDAVRSRNHLSSHEPCEPPVSKSAT